MGAPLIFKVEVPTLGAGEWSRHKDTRQLWLGNLLSFSDSETIKFVRPSAKADRCDDSFDLHVDIESWDEFAATSHNCRLPMPWGGWNFSKIHLFDKANRQRLDGLVRSRAFDSRCCFLGSLSIFLRVPHSFNLSPAPFLVSRTSPFSNSA